MIDEIFDRTYQSGRAHLHDGLDTLFRRTADAVDNAFRVLNRIEYSAPWTDSRRTKGRA